MLNIIIGPYGLRKKHTQASLQTLAQLHFLTISPGPLSMSGKYCRAIADVQDMDELHEKLGNGYIVHEDVRSPSI